MTRWLLVAAISIFAAGAWAQGKVATVGVLSYATPVDYAPHLEQLRKGLRDLGYVESRNLRLEVRYAGGKFERLPQLAAELAAIPVDVLVAEGSTVTRVTRKVTRSIPIVMAYSGDPVGGGLADSLSRPGGRITGLTTLSPELAGKRLEILREVLPKMDDVALLWNPGVPERVTQFQETEAAAKRLGITVHSFEARRRDEIERALTALAAKRPDAMILLRDALLSANLRMIARFALEHRIAVMDQIETGPQAGLLLSYAPSHPAMHYRAAAYVDKILKGAKPGDLPIEQPTQFKLVINLGTAKTLGITIPQSVLARSGAVIQ